MLRHDLRRALLSPRTLFVALAYGVLLSLGATETWNDSAAYQFAFSYKTGFYILFYLCAVLPYGCGYLEDRLSGYWRFFQTRCSSTRYSVSKVLVTALSGALVVLAGGGTLYIADLRRVCRLGAAGREAGDHCHCPVFGAGRCGSAGIFRIPGRLRRPLGYHRWVHLWLFAVRPALLGADGPAGK